MFMKWKGITHEVDTCEKTNGTSLQGYTQTIDREDMKAMFGSNSYPDCDGKVSTEWVIEFDDGLVATLYDYRAGIEEVREGYQWHIGGKESVVVGRVRDIIRRYKAIY